MYIKSIINLFVTKLKNTTVKYYDKWSAFYKFNNKKLFLIFSIILYSYQTATISIVQSGWSLGVTSMFIGGGFLMLNVEFVKNILSLYGDMQAVRNIKSEIIFVTSMGMTNIFLFACFYYMYGVNGQGHIIKADWITSIYFSIVTWTTLGYGDYSPIYGLRLVAAFEALIGYTYMALLVGLFLNHAKHMTYHKKI